MKQVYFIVALVIMAISFVFLVFTLSQVSQEQLALSADLQYRTRLLADGLKEAVEPYYLQNSTSALEKVINKFTNRRRLVGLVVYDNKGKVVTASADLSEELINNPALVSEAMDSNQPVGGFVKREGASMYILTDPLHDGDRVIGAFAVIQKADYIDAKLGQIWRNNLLRLFLQILLFAGAIIIVVRWIFFKPIFRLVESVKLTRSGRSDPETYFTARNNFLNPLVSEISKMSASLLQARRAAREEARMRLEKLDTPWTSERLKEFISLYLKHRPIITVSNREPYVHTKVKSEIQFQVPASGMVTALEPVMEACGGIWVAHGSGDADKGVVDKHDKIQVPPDEPKYTLRRVWLTEKEEGGYYYGFSNEALYPLCLMTHNRPIFRKEDWDEYRKVNGKFAQAVLSEIKNLYKPLIMIQDFHLALLPRMVKKSRPDAAVSLFWHIPWVSAESFSICPWRKEILEGMLGADLVGFHTQLYCNNFIETVGRELESLIDFEQFTVTRGEHTSAIKPFPASVAFSPQWPDSKNKIDSKKVLKRLGIEVKYVGLGVDRMDYAKGILEKFKGIEIFLNTYPSYREQFAFIQIAAPSKSKIRKYQEFSEAVRKETERINERFKTKNWKPIYLIERHHTHDEINEIYKAANFCLVASLHDGMNLVAKEFVAARDDEKGVLILSQFAGASRELKNALIINPYSGEQTAEAIRLALEMTTAEQKSRMKNLRGNVKNSNVYRWSAELLKAMADLE